MVAPETRRRLLRAAQYAGAARDEGVFLLAIVPEGWFQLTYEPGAPPLRPLPGFRPKPAELSRLEIQWHSETRHTERKWSSVGPTWGFAFSNSESHLKLF